MLPARSRTLLAGLTALASIAAGCGRADAPPRDTSSGTAAAAAPIQTRSPAPASVVPLAARSIATIEIENPDEIVLAAGSVWVKTDDGRVVQVDPRTNRVVGEVKVDRTSDPRHYCHGLGSDGTRLWACAARDRGSTQTIDVVRIDPQTRRVVATFDVGKIFHQFEMPVVSGRLWVLSGTGDRVVGIDVGTDRIEPAIELGIAGCTQLAAAGDALLVACPQGDEIVEIDVERRAIKRRVRFEDARLIVAGAGSVWVARMDSVVRLDRETLRPVVAFSSLRKVGSSGDIVATDHAVWVRHEDGFLHRIDPESEEIVEQITAGSELSGGSLLVTEDAIWTTATDDRRLMRLRPGR